MPSSRIMIIGAGSMGQGLAEAVATAGHEVVLVDKKIKLAELGLKRIGESIDREISRWGLTSADKKAILSRIYPSSDLTQAEDAEIVLESIPEDLKAKQELFQELDLICPPETLLITNTGTLSISEIAAATKRPSKIIGMHFLNPVTKIPLVEIVKGLKTDDDTFQKAVEFAELLDKKWITVIEYPGYVTTRIIVPLLNEAMHVLMEGVASARDIDRAMRLGFGFNVGPLALADMMGLDVVMSWMMNLLNELSEHKYNPCPILRKLVRAGHLGVKTGRGFFRYDAEGNRLTEEQEKKQENG
ncbi:MAG: 3-hydroxyacyl-CoA dehydrogenase NAD-binding domain-containing protein [candidate division Zixibacteria bacterium]|nr:3-hydroxyacyl-CoA dehydrogenase NAD-binding domain-containing protein [candidate division Zixibacteria bacterium]MDD5426395.1 3-hydroxyacyl-CoA dehydrogenase NAD-binding domain-containing protein [candidate division Zixibacteria bacterium]